jgi:hypothetical protein
MLIVHLLMQLIKHIMLVITRTGTTLSATIFDRERKWADDLVESISINPLNDVDTIYKSYMFLML